MRLLAGVLIAFAALAASTSAVANPPHLWPANAHPVVHHAVKLRVGANQIGAASSRVRIPHDIQIERIVVNGHSLMVGDSLRDGDAIMYGAGAAVRVSAPSGGVVRVTVANVKHRPVRVVVRFHRSR